jgi:hypothetical protein
MSKTEPRNLSVALEAWELQERSNKMAEKELEYVRVEEEKKETTKELGDQMKSIRVELYRSVVCTWVLEGGEMVLKRPDTGEIVDRRAPTKEELQQELPGLTGEEPKAKALKVAK